MASSVPLEEMERKSSPLNFEGARDLEDSSLKGHENDRYELIHRPSGNLTLLIPALELKSLFLNYF